MGSYMEVIKTALIFFPAIALMISVPFILIQYHKFGSISFLKSLIIYSFVLYLICAYFLVVLPLPRQEEVALLTTPRIQLIPLKFIGDFINNTSLNIMNVSTYLKAMTESYFYVPIYNLFLTMPFAMYVRYYYQTSLKKTIFYTFLLSLFFELTQLSGLYFVYPRGYRLFDIDDLILNTLGGIGGYLLAGFIIKRLPGKEMIDKRAKIKGMQVSGLRRLTSVLLDIFVLSIINGGLNFILPNVIRFDYQSYVIIFLYYILCPYFMEGQTLGEKFLNLKVVTYNEENKFFRLLYRKCLFIICYFIFPILVIVILPNLKNIISNYYIEIFVSIFLVSLIFILYCISFFKFIFTTKEMRYERISKTKLVSTIKESE